MKNKGTSTDFINIDSGWVKQFFTHISLQDLDRNLTILRMGRSINYQMKDICDCCLRFELVTDNQLKSESCIVRLYCFLKMFGTR
jgi:hypothetical protein